MEVRFMTLSFFNGGVMYSTKQKYFRCVYRAFIYFIYDSFLKNFMYFSIGVVFSAYFFRQTVITVFTTPFFNNFTGMCKAFLH